MEEFSLIAHPDASAGAVRAIMVRAERVGSLLRMQYEVTGNIGGVIWPAVATPRFADGLWQHSCFEAFLVAPSSAAYVEINLSPSGEWATYAFDAYRAGMRRADGVQVDTIEFTRSPTSAVLSATINLGPFAPTRAGFAAVIEQASGKSYWALAHPPGPPDFHDPACFTARLPPPVSP